MTTNPEEEEERMCRYCFDDESAGPLISPCKCAGGQKYVHLTCLHRWQRMVLVTQPTHPAYHDKDMRHHTCNVCKSKFTCPPPTRHELMASFTGPEIAAMIEKDCIIVSHESFNKEMETQLLRMPAMFREACGYNHWIKAVMLISKVEEDNERLVELRIPAKRFMESIKDKIIPNDSEEEESGDVSPSTTKKRSPDENLESSNTSEKREESPAKRRKLVDDEKNKTFKVKDEEIPPSSSSSSAAKIAVSSENITNNQLLSSPENNPEPSASSDTSPSKNRNKDGFVNTSKIREKNPIRLMLSGRRYNIIKAEPTLPPWEDSSDSDMSESDDSGDEELSSYIKDNCAKIENVRAALLKKVSETKKSEDKKKKEEVDKIVEIANANNSSASNQPSSSSSSAVKDENNEKTENFDKIEKWVRKKKDPEVSGDDEADDKDEKKQKTNNSSSDENTKMSDKDRLKALNKLLKESDPVELEEAIKDPLLQELIEPARLDPRVLLEPSDLEDLEELEEEEEESAGEVYGPDLPETSEEVQYPQPENLHKLSPEERKKRKEEMKAIKKKQKEFLKNAWSKMSVREKFEHIKCPCSITLEAADPPNCGHDHVVALNLSREVAASEIDERFVERELKKVKFKEAREKVTLKQQDVKQIGNRVLGGGGRGWTVMKNLHQAVELAHTRAVKRSDDEGDIHGGCVVKMKDLKAAAELNGQSGVALRFSPDNKRWLVRLANGDGKQIKPENLDVIGPKDGLVMCVWGDARWSRAQLIRCQINQGQK